MLIIPTEKRFDWQRAPFVLIALVLINILVFFTYQSGDDDKATDAVWEYLDSGFFDAEWPIYIDFLERQSESPLLDEVKQAYAFEDYESAAYAMLMNPSYYQHIQRAAQNAFPYDDYLAWKEPRAQIQQRFDSISSLALGLRSNDVSLTTLFSHQFLHGGLMHLVGNMVFLIVFGFAVEAALGHVRFLSFYLVGGVFAGFAQVWVTPGSDVPLIGASGAISGVMAMYLAVFRLRKIEFFYWILFFVGYFRAPALLILPFYIGKEVYSYVQYGDSNVAFMAHAGGFAAGAVLIGMALLLNRTILNDDYLEQDQSHSTRQKGLAGIYKAIESFRFDLALKQTYELIAKEGLDFDLALLRFNLEKIRKGKNYLPAFRSLMSQRGLSDPELEKLRRIWLETEQAERLLPNAAQLQLAFQFTRLNNLDAAQAIAERLHNEKFDPPQVLMLATKLTRRFAEQKDTQRSRRFHEICQQLTQEGVHGFV